MSWHDPEPVLHWPHQNHPAHLPVFGQFGAHLSVESFRVSFSNFLALILGDAASVCSHTLPSLTAVIGMCFSWLA